jgi:hypothetical protein
VLRVLAFCSCWHAAPHAPPLLLLLPPPTQPAVIIAAARRLLLIVAVCARCRPAPPLAPACGGARQLLVFSRLGLWRG